MKTNCLIFALKKWFKHGGYLIIRKSNHGYFPHFLWSKDLKNAHVEHYVPIDPKRTLLRVLLHKILFEGYIKTHDRKDEK